jgi:hypothetical protein
MGDTSFSRRGFLEATAIAGGLCLIETSYSQDQVGAEQDNRTSSESYPVYNEKELYGTTGKNVGTKTTFKLGESQILYPVRGEHNLAPQGIVEYYINGTEGATFSTTLTFEGQGGHNHHVGSNDARATGTITPQSGTISGPYPQNIRQVYRAGDMCGRVRDNSNVGGTSFLEYYNIMIQGLQALSAGTGVCLVGGTSTHPSNHWGTPSLCDGINQLGAAFQAQFNKPIYVNDMSLMWGGLFDFKADLSPPHQTHRYGHDVDMNYSSMTEAERTWFKAKAESLGFTVEIHPNPDHWHLTR